MAITIAGIRSVPIVGTFVSNIFKKSRYAKWKGKGWERFVDDYQRVGREHPRGYNYYPYYVQFIVGNQLPPYRPSGKPVLKRLQTAKNTRWASNWILAHVANWNKDMQKNIRDHLATVGFLPEPIPKPPIEVHTLSASYKPEAKTKTTAEPRLFQAGISKIPIYVLVGIGALFILPQLLKTKGGKE